MKYIFFILLLFISTNAHAAYRAPKGSWAAILQLKRTLCNLHNREIPDDTFERNHEKKLELLSRRLEELENKTTLSQREKFERKQLEWSLIRKIKAIAKTIIDE